jgi:triphosphoribosyl-dephospho-CoA synthase
MTALPPETVAQAFITSCKAELTALKPGNVHVHAGGHHMEVAQFAAAAKAAAPFIADPALKPGQRIRAAVGASMDAADCNTNLGIILLCGPLAAAAQMRRDGESLRQRLAEVLNGLDMEDTLNVYLAIRRANPGGLGKTDDADVSDVPTLPLIEAMALAAPRDRIAANYVSSFSDIFDDHLPLLNRISAGRASQPPPAQADAVSTLYMSLLARYTDSHIRRKFGLETAAHVQRLAQAAKPCWHPVVRAQSHAGLLDLDTLLKSEGWNPGTTADFVVATVFAAEIERLNHH